MASHIGQLAAEIVKAALSRPVNERAAYLAASCAGNETLRQEVEHMLRLYQNPEMHSGSLLNSPSKRKPRSSRQSSQAHPLSQTPKTPSDPPAPSRSSQLSAPTVRVDANDLPADLRQTLPAPATEPTTEDTASLAWLARLTAEAPNETATVDPIPEKEEATPFDKSANEEVATDPSTTAYDTPTVKKSDPLKVFDADTPFDRLFRRVTLPPQQATPAPSPAVSAPATPSASPSVSPSQTEALDSFQTTISPPSAAQVASPPSQTEVLEPFQTTIAPSPTPAPNETPFAATPPPAVEGFTTGAKKLDGRMLGPYQLLYELGRGGMGRVYLAEDMRLGRRVALKLLLRSSTRSPERVRRFEQEARAASSLNHPNILTIHEIGEIKGVHYLATEFVEGFTLRQVIDSRNLSLTKIIDVAIQIADALAAAHDANIAHRDIKPENLMIRADGYVKVLDFGVAKLIERNAGTSADLPTTQPFDTQPGTVIGTADYMSPEQARGVRVDYRTDIFSLGVVLYEMVTGVRPFVGATPTDVVAALLTHEPIPITQRLSGAPEALHRIIKRALHKERDQRYASAREMARDLKLLKQDLEIAARTTKRPSQRIPREPRTTPPHIQRPTSQAPPRSDPEQWDSGPTASEPVNWMPPSPMPNASPSLPRMEARPRNTTAPSTKNAAGTVRVQTRKVDSPMREGKWWAWVLLAFAVTGLGIGIWANYLRTPGNIVLAIMPFTATHLSGGNAPLSPEDEEALRLSLSEGLHESLIQRLGVLPKLHLIARNSVRNLRKGLSVAEIANYLNARYVLTGRLVTRGSSVTVSLELFDGETGKSQWSQRYERTLNELHTLPESLSPSLVEPLGLSLNTLQTARLARRDTINSEAYLAYLRGRYLWQQRRAPELKASLNYLRRATELDANFARAHAALAESYALALSYGPAYGPAYGLMPSTEAAIAGRAAASKALILDTQLAEAYRAQGVIAHQYEWNFAAAEKAFQRALEINPNYAAAHQEYGSLLTSVGRSDEGFRVSQAARELDPLSSASQTNVAAAQYFAGRYQQTVDECLGVIEFNPKAAGAFKYLGLAYQQMSRMPDALEAMQKAVSLEPQNPELKAQLACIEADAGKSADAQLHLKELRAGFIPQYRLATVYAALGDKEQAIAALTQAVANHEPGVVWLKVDPQMNLLRNDQRFKELLKQIGLP